MMVYPQASGGGSATIRNRAGLDLRAGSMIEDLQIEYTADR